MSKSLAIQNAQRFAYDRLASPTVKDKKTGRDVPNKFYVSPENITCPAIISQEILFTNNNPTFKFDFSQNAPKATVNLDNILLGQNDIFCTYAMRMMIGYGATVDTRQYRTFGATVQDDTAYRGDIEVKYEIATLQAKIKSSLFRDENGTFFRQEDGIVLTNPLRILTGRLSIFQYTLVLQSTLSSLTLTPNMVIRMELHGALGQPEVTGK